MTLDDETARRIVREAVEKNEVWSGRYVELVRAGWEARDAEVEELRAERDSVQAALDGFRGVAKRDNEYLIGQRDAALATLAKVADLLGSLDLDSDHMTAPGTAWGSILREALALARGADESPTERETFADEWEYRARWDGDDSLWFGVAAERVSDWMAAGYEVQRRRKQVWEVVPDDRA